MQRDEPEPEQREPMREDELERASGSAASAPVRKAAYNPWCPICRSSSPCPHPDH